MKNLNSFCNLEVTSGKNNDHVADIWKRWEESSTKFLNEDHEHFGITCKHFLFRFFCFAHVQTR